MASHQLCPRVGRRTEHNFPVQLDEGCTIILMPCGGQTDCPICVGNVNSALIRKAKTGCGEAF